MGIIGKLLIWYHNKIKPLWSDVPQLEDDVSCKSLPIYFKTSLDIAYCIKSYIFDLNFRACQLRNSEG